MDLPQVDFYGSELAQAVSRTRQRRRVARTPYERPAGTHSRQAQAGRSVQSPAAFVQGLFQISRSSQHQQSQQQPQRTEQQQQPSHRKTDQLIQPALILPETEPIGMELGWPCSFTDHYDLGGCIGTGAFGTVHLATNRASNQHVAVKILAKSRAKQTRDKTLAKVRREANMLAQVQECAGIARFLGRYEDHDFAYMVLELCNGGDLEQLLEARTTLTEPEAALILYEILKVISTCHQVGVVHGDVKPANFLLRQPLASSGPCALGDLAHDGACLRAIDFGCSQYVKPNQLLSKRTGTPVYLAPEVYMRAYDHRADMWSLGMMFFHLMTRAFPFWPSMDACRNSSLDSVMKAVTTAHIDIRAQPIQDMSPAGLHLLKQLLRRDPVLRISADDALQHEFFQQHLVPGISHDDCENDSSAANRLASSIQPAGQACSLLRYLKFCELCSAD